MSVIYDEIYYTSKQNRQIRISPCGKLIFVRTLKNEIVVLSRSERSPESHIVACKIQNIAGVEILDFLALNNSMLVCLSTDGVLTSIQLSPNSDSSYSCRINGTKKLHLHKNEDPCSLARLGPGMIALSAIKSDSPPNFSGLGSLTKLSNIEQSDNIGTVSIAVLEYVPNLRNFTFVCEKSIPVTKSINEHEYSVGMEVINTENSHEGLSRSQQSKITKSQILLNIFKQKGEMIILSFNGELLEECGNLEFGTRISDCVVNKHQIWILDKRGTVKQYVK